MAGTVASRLDMMLAATWDREARREGKEARRQGGDARRQGKEVGRQGDHLLSAPLAAPVHVVEPEIGLQVKLLPGHAVLVLPDLPLLGRCGERNGCLVFTQGKLGVCMPLLLGLFPLGSPFLCCCSRLLSLFFLRF